MKSFDMKVVVRLCMLVLLATVYLTACKEEYDHTVDVQNPTLVSSNPVSGVKEVSVNSTLQLTFSEFIKKGKGSIVITGSAAPRTIDVASDAVKIGEDARVLTITPGELESDVQYTVTMEKGVVTDLLGNDFMGTDTGKPWVFTTAGDAGPLVVTTAPENGANDGSLFKLEISFLAAVQKGEGNVTIFNAKNEKVAEISVAGNAVNVQGKKVTIQLGSPLSFATPYYVKIDNGAFVDGNKKKFKGYLDDSSWKFTTTAGSGSDLVVHLPMDGNLADESGNKFDASQGSTASAGVVFVNDPARGKVANFVAGSYAVLPRHPLLRPSNSQSFSFSMWLKFKGIGSDPVIFSNSDWDSGGNPGFVFCTDGAETYTGPGTPGRGWLVKLAGGGRMDWRAGEMTPQAPALADQKWHHVTVVVNQQTKILHVYMDGKEYLREGHAGSRDLKTLTGSLWDEAKDYPFTIWEDGTGLYNAGSDERKKLAGFVDDVRVYKKALTPAEVSDLFLSK